MALTFAKQRTVNVGHLYLNEYLVTFDSSYPTGGEAITAADFGLNVIDAVLSVNTDVPVAATKTVKFDPATSKLTISAEDGTSGVNADAANGSDQSAVIARVFILGH